MATISATTKVTKFINKFEKSQDYEDILAGSYGPYPMMFDDVKLSNKVVIYTDRITDRAMEKRYLLIYVVVKDGRFYDRVIEKKVEIPEDMAEYVKAAEGTMLEIANEIDNKGLLK
jgi:hypothetical protein